MSEDTKNHPAFDVHVVGGDGPDSSWTRVGAAWPTKFGGFSIALQPGVAVSGRLVLTPYGAHKKAGE